MAWSPWDWTAAVCVCVCVCVIFIYLVVSSYRFFVCLCVLAQWVIEGMMGNVAPSGTMQHTCDLEYALTVSERCDSVRVIKSH